MPLMSCLQWRSKGQPRPMHLDPQPVIPGHCVWILGFVGDKYFWIHDGWGFWILSEGIRVHPGSHSQGTSTPWWILYRWGCTLNLELSLKSDIPAITFKMERSKSSDSGFFAAILRRSRLRSASTPRRDKTKSWALDPTSPGSSVCARNCAESNVSVDRPPFRRSLSSRLSFMKRSKSQSNVSREGDNHLKSTKRHSTGIFLEKEVTSWPLTTVQSSTGIPIPADVSLDKSHQSVLVPGPSSCPDTRRAPNQVRAQIDSPAQICSISCPSDSVYHNGREQAPGNCNHNAPECVMTVGAAQWRASTRAREAINSGRQNSLSSSAQPHRLAPEGPQHRPAAAVSSKSTVSHIVSSGSQAESCHYEVKESSILQLSKENSPASIEGNEEDDDEDDVNSPGNVLKDILAHCERSAQGLYSCSTPKTPAAPGGDEVTCDMRGAGPIKRLDPPYSSLTSRDSGFDQLDRSKSSAGHPGVISPIRASAPDPILASLSFPSEDSDEDSDGFYGKVVVRKSRSYHDLVRKRSRSKSRSSQQESSDLGMSGSFNSDKQKSHLRGTYFMDTSSTGHSDRGRDGLVVSSRSRKEIHRMDMVEESPEGMRRTGSLDSLSVHDQRSSVRKEEDLHQLKRRSMLVDYEACSRMSQAVHQGAPPRSRHWKSTGSITGSASKKARKKEKLKNGERTLYVIRRAIWHFMHAVILTL